MAAKKTKKKVAKKTVKKSVKKVAKKAVKKTAKKAAKKTAKKSAASAEKTFIVTYHMSPAAHKKAAAIRKKNPNAMQEGYQQWMAWGQKMGAHLVEFGSPFAGSVKLDSKGASPSKRQITGYSVMKAKSMAEMKRLLKNHPHLSWVSAGCEIEVHETAPM